MHMPALFWTFSKEQKAGVILKAVPLAQLLEFPFASFDLSLQEEENHLEKFQEDMEKLIMGTCVVTHI